MVGRRSLPMELSMDDSVLYLTSVKETLDDEPAKFKEFLKILTDIKAHRIYKDYGIARMTELIKEHPKLIRGLSVFLPRPKIIIPPKAKGLDKFKTISCINVSQELRDLHTPIYMYSVEWAFATEPEKRKKWHKLMDDCKARRMRMTDASFIPKLEEVMKDHRHLLLGFSVFLRAGAKIILPPEAKPKPDINVGSNDPDYDPDFIKKTGKRKKSHASPPRKKVKLNKRTVHCKKCGQAGHNSRSCSN